MGQWDPLNESALVRQIARQRRHAWEPSSVLNWNQPIDTSRPLVALDDNALFFPKASNEQRLAISQFVGLMVNATICEMESVINQLKEFAWNQLLRSYPANPELQTLGELFFHEENRHAKIFEKYNQSFYQAAGLDAKDFERLLPKAFGSQFLSSIIRNAKNDGHAFWWVIAMVEEASIEVFRLLREHKGSLEPLYYELHKAHFHDEVRHRNYAFMMLDLVLRRHSSWRRKRHRRFDLLLAQSLICSWTLSEIHKIYRVKKLKEKHPLYQTLNSCLSLVHWRQVPKLVYQLFWRAPYVSHLMNIRYYPQLQTMIRKQRAFSLPYPKPKVAPLYA